MDFLKKYRNVFLSLALIVLLVSCMDDGDDYVSEPVEVAYVSIYHAAPAAPEFDIVVDGRVINRNPFDYTSYSGYLNFFTGNREFRFNPVNANNTLVDTTFNFEDGKAYSLFAINESAGKVSTLLVADSAAAPAEGNAMVRFVHLSPDAPAFDIVVNGNESPIFTGKSFTGSTDFEEVDAGNYSFHIRNAGSEENLLSATDVEIVAGRYYTIVVRGFLSPPEGNSNALSVEVLD